MVGYFVLLWLIWSLWACFSLRFPRPRSSNRLRRRRSNRLPPTNPTFVLRAQSNVVRIDVEVTDGSGKPIKGLRADQFEVTDDGKQQKISSFSYSDIEKIETAAEDNTKPIVVPVDNAGPGAPTPSRTRSAIAA